MRVPLKIRICLVFGKCQQGTEWHVLVLQSVGLGSAQLIKKNSMRTQILGYAKNTCLTPGLNVNNTLYQLVQVK